MKDTPYHIRNYRPADFNDFVLLYLTAEQEEPLGRPATPQAITEGLARPGYDPTRDLFLVQAGDDTVGFLDIKPELGIGRVLAEAWLLPEHRRKGLGRRLLRAAIKRAGELGAGFVHVGIPNENVAAKNVLNRLGFRYVRRFLELSLDLANIDWPELETALAGCRHLGEGEAALLTRLQNRSFADHWGYQRNTPETTAHEMGLSHRSRRDIVLAGDADAVTGYCWTEITAPGEGRVYMLGTDPDFQGQGIGRRTLLAGLAHLKGHGVRRVWLTVDGANETANALYASVGFKPRQTYLWYEMAVG